MKPIKMRKTNFSASNQEDDDDVAVIYNLEKIKIEEDFCVQKAHPGTWSATKSSLFEKQSYEFVIK